MQRRSLLELEERCREAKRNTNRKRLEYMRNYYREHREEINAKRSGQEHLNLEQLRKRWEQ